MNASQTTLDLFNVPQVNLSRMGKQNLRLYEYLRSGGRIHWFHKKMRELGIGVLNSRISDLRNKYHIPVKDEPVKVQDARGEWTTVKEYYLLSPGGERGVGKKKNDGVE